MGRPLKLHELVSRNDASSAICVYEISYERGRIIPPCCHDRPELVAVLSGEVHVTFAAERYHFTKGDVVFLVADIEHRDVEVRRTARIFRCTVKDSLFARAEFNAPVTVVRSESLEGALSRLISEARQSDRGMPLALEAAALAVLASARRRNPPREVTRRQERMEDAIRLVRDTSYALGEIAKRCGFYDQAHLARAFRRDLGITPTEYRRRHTFAV